MTTSTKAALGIVLGALTLATPAAVAGATAPTPPPSDTADTTARPAPDDPFCAAGFVLLDAEAVLDDDANPPALVRSNIRQLVRAAERAAAVSPPEVGDLDDLVGVLQQIEAHYAGHDFDADAAEDDPAMDHLEEEYEAQLGVAGAATDYLEQMCAEIVGDDTVRAVAFCAAMERLGTADDAFAEAREGDDPDAVEATWNDYVHAFDEVRVVGPDELRETWDALRVTLGESEALLADHGWDYAAFEEDPAFEDVMAAYEEPEVQRWSTELDEYVGETCELGESTPDTGSAP